MVTAPFSGNCAGFNCDPLLLLRPRRFHYLPPRLPRPPDPDPHPPPPRRRLSRRCVQPLYAELAVLAQSLIEQGTLRPGHRVPSVRMMSQRGVSIATVLQAYTVLENRGYLEARPQSGYYVRRPAFLSPEPRTAKPMAKPASGVKD